MFINSINSYSSIHNFNSKYKIPQYYYYSINNNHIYDISCSSLSLSSISSSFLNQSKSIFQSKKVKNIHQHTDSLSSLSTTSFSSSITIILHSLHRKNKKRKKFLNKNHKQYQNNNYSSSSSISLSQLTNKNKIKHSSNKILEKSKSILFKKNSININQYSISNYDQEFDNQILLKKSHHIFNEEKTTSFYNKNSSSNSISDLNNLNITEIDIENFNCNQSTQTENYSLIEQQYQYGNLRRVNSNLLDYIFIPISNKNNY